MANSSTYYPPVSFFFKVFFQGLKGKADKEASFKEVSGLSAETSAEEVIEGGVLQYRHKLPTTTKYPNLILKRGLILDSELRQWIEKGINEFSFTPLMVSVHLLDQFSQEGQNSKTLMSWTFHNVWPVKWEIAQFDSLSNEVAVESIELAYDYFETKKGA
ncbi:phage tail protein [Flavilitoribacter nigricans]|uniref:Phage tail protein n=1 Tax=Flavilitoribacter nigricans (strain ATCC 23147 / DSM 23189 / NBRC 102662 / NCIMB 1420 / SS-2) TaxID=1122177 RepID=A0A2D0N1F9_FLAN2|nr:phage tail protein [Flavilitoribacter nigricans]PHN02218.1 phage tail protein [Flavilitoribacter nigricans DSM 23189 = NBRC 102662]